MSEMTGNHADVRVHPPILMALHLFPAFLLGWLIPVDLPAWLEMVGWAVVLFGLAVALYALQQLIKARTSPDPFVPTTAVVTKGIYRFTRNPIYLGYLCFTLGFPLLFGNIWGLVVAPIQIILFDRLIIFREEDYLSSKFGQLYLDYKSSVRRWL